MIPCSDCKRVHIHALYCPNTEPLPNFDRRQDERDDMDACWAEVEDSESLYLIPPQVESAHPIEAGEDFWVGGEWWPLSIKATEGER